MNQPRKLRDHLDTNPSFLRRDWLPANSGWSELDALHAEHVQLLDARDGELATIRAVRRKHEAEDEARQQALRESFRTGGEAAAAKTTSPEERPAELAAAVERYEAASDALEEFVGDALAQLEARREQWFADLDERVAEGERKRGGAAASRGSRRRGGRARPHAHVARPSDGRQARTDRVRGARPSARLPTTRGPLRRGAAAPRARRRSRNRGDRIVINRPGFSAEARVVLRLQPTAEPRDYPRRWFPELLTRADPAKGRMRSADEGYPEHWLPDVKARRAREQQRPRVVHG